MTAAPIVPDGRLVFSFNECDEELTSFGGISHDFLDATAPSILDRFRRRLLDAKSAPTGRFQRWEIRPEEPIRTIVSDGEYGGGRSLFAAVDGVWEIDPLGPHNTKSLGGRLFSLGGQASARVQLFDANTGEECAMWRMEIGDDASPGCFFHTQIRGQVEANPFPKSIDVPRLPTNVVLLPGAIEFVLAELFQERWAENAARETGQMKRWRPIQQRRLLGQFAWQSRVVATGLGSPWTRLKRERPPADLFTS